MNIKQGYLLLYNFAQFCGWFYYFLRFLYYFSQGMPIREIFDKEFFLLKVIQWAMCMEILHSIVKIVETRVETTFAQIYGRIGLLFCWMYAEHSRCYGFAMTSIAWGITESLRYSYYVLSILKAYIKTPYWMTWCRYSFFVVLYPLGMSGEIICLLNGYNDLKVYKYGKFNCSYLVIFEILLYIRAVYLLFPRMFLLRKYKLGAKKAKKPEKDNKDSPKDATKKDDVKNAVKDEKDNKNTIETTDKKNQ